MQKNIDDAIKLINSLKQSKNRVLIAVDGMSCSGKSTFSAALSGALKATLIHCDDFFLRPEQRTQERLSTSGGNLDTERLISEVIEPVIKGEDFIYKPFNCHTMDFDESKTVSPSDIVILEGSYSCHPDLYNFFDIHIFLYTDRLSQICRLLLRGGYDKTKIFIEKWIPMENKYFDYFNIKNKCDLILKT